MVHSIDVMPVDFEDKLADLETASVEGGPVLVDVDDAWEGVLGVGAPLDRNAQNRLGLFHRDVQIATVIRYNAGTVLRVVRSSAVVVSVAPRSSARSASPSAMEVVVVHMVVPVLVQGQPLHGLVPAH